MGQFNQYFLPGSKTKKLMKNYKKFKKELLLVIILNSLTIVNHVVIVKNLNALNSIVIASDHQNFALTVVVEIA